ncbi:fumarylacetoacetate hydrolase family protein [Ilyonectria sp. MPI-CAGE-AT-0026]|nr:fumarylacetoacetate hydrolase family protein [Ilyonectria sp. MPI-CAGE-AT-0026]
MSFKQLVRFEEKGQAHYGDLVEFNDTQGHKVSILSGNPWDGLIPTGRTTTVSKLLAPLEHTPIIICVGLNYRKHAAEANLQVPTYPVVFTKPSDSLAGPFDNVHAHPDAQVQLDYEGELCVILGRDAKNVSEKEALDYVLGYTAGNDVSARNFQLPSASGGQFCYAKSFDGFAPIGPAIWSPTLVPDPQNLYYKTTVNGKVVQETATSDMIWSVQQIIAHLSRGTTLRQGTVIMMGTPSGVGFFKGEFLQDGDVVEVDVEGLGKISNRMVFDS